MKQMTKQKASHRRDPLKVDKHNDLAETIEALRKERFPTVPKELVTKVLKVETENVAPDDRHAAQAKLREIVEAYLESKKD
jgi:hypothetical protein